MKKKRLFFDMDGVLVNFQSGIDKLSEEVKREYEGRLDEVQNSIPQVITISNRLQIELNLNLTLRHRLLRYRRESA